MVDRHDPLPGVETPIIAHQDVDLKMVEACAGVDDKLLPDHIIELRRKL